MTTPQILSDLFALLLDLAVPAAMCTLVLAGLALRSESGVNFEAGGRFQRWMVWSVILLHAAAVAVMVRGARHPHASTGWRSKQCVAEQH